MARFEPMDPEWAVIAPVGRTDTRGVGAWTTAVCSTGFPGICVRARPELMYRRCMDLKRLAATASGGGATPRFQIAFSMRR